MGTLQFTKQDNTYRINAPAYCAALTRSGGEASPHLITKIGTALMHAGKCEHDDHLTFSRGLKSHRWYVHVGA